MRSLSYILLLCVLLALSDCDGDRHCAAVLDRADSLSRLRPDSALSLLESISPEMDKMSRRQQMRWQLLRICAQNRCDTVFRSDSIQMALVEYYDRHGSPNERMMAHYLLGRAYSDMGDSPNALKYFHNALQTADTLAADCDFYSLASICGQIAMTFNRQHLPIEEIKAWNSYSHFSLCDSDIYNYIKGKELQIPSYYTLDDTAQCFRITREVSQLYRENGMPEMAARVYPVAILIHLQNHQYAQARQLMDIFKNESGLNDDSGNIARGLETNYYNDGLYFLGVNKPDSAEYYFRKLLPIEYNRNFESYSGLLSVYRHKHNVDSVMKYVELTQQAVDSIHADDQAEALAIAHSLYNYHVVEKAALQNKIEAERNKAWIWVITALCAVIFTVGYRKYAKYREEKKLQLSMLTSEYQDAVRKYEANGRELQMLREDTEAIIEAKQVEIGQLKKRIGHYREQLSHFPSKDKEKELLSNHLTKSFHEMANGKPETAGPTRENWKQLTDLLSQLIPSFYARIFQDSILSYQEQVACVLTRLKFSNAEIALLLETSPQRVSNIKASANEKLFGESHARSLSTNLTEI